LIELYLDFPQFLCQHTVNLSLGKLLQLPLNNMSVKSNVFFLQCYKLFVPLCKSVPSARRNLNNIMDMDMDMDMIYGYFRGSPSTELCSVISLKAI
jgi:hypothetical protein